MKFTIVTILAFVAGAQALNDWSEMVPVERASRNSKIIGGQPAFPHQFPHQVFLNTRMANVFENCGGSIIRADIILTAAHCIENALYTEVYAGAHNLSVAEPDRQLIISTQYVIHEGWDITRLINDIALIILPTKFRIDGITTSVISLRYGGCPDTTLTGLPTTISGWGKQFNSSTGVTDILRHVSSTIMTLPACTAFYQNGLIDSHICFDGAGKIGACQGDSGGPMTVFTNTGGLQLVGVTSFVYKFGCEEGYPSVYTRVSCFTDWIHSNIRK